MITKNLNIKSIKRLSMSIESILIIKVGVIKKNRDIF